MNRFVVLTLTAVCLLAGRPAASQSLPARWDELTASDWPRALERSGGTAILPIGVLEKHGPHAPIGSDLIHVREWAARATKTRIRRRLSRLLLRPDLRGAAPAGHLRAAEPPAVGSARGDVRRDCAQRLQENPHHQRPRRQPELPALLRAGAARTPARLRRLLPRSGARSRAHRAGHEAAQVGPGRRRSRRRARDVHAAVSAAGPGQAGSRVERVGRQPEAADAARSLHRDLVVRVVPEPLRRRRRGRHARARAADHRAAHRFDRQGAAARSRPTRPPRRCSRSSSIAW